MYCFWVYLRNHIENRTKRERKNGIDGIDIGAIMGINKNKTIHQIYLDKMNYIEKTKIDMEAENNSNSEAVYWNLTLKEIISNFLLILLTLL